MIKTKKQMFIVIAIFALIILLGGTTYAWFTYRREGTNQTLIAGDIYLKLEEGNDTISLTNIFPETKEEARSRNDNYLTFEINGINESDKTIYYEIDLNHGTDRDTPYVRFDDEDLRFDLVELDSNGDEVRYLLNNVGYDKLVNKKIWVDTIESGSSTEVSKKYKLRMWLSEDVLISDSDPNRDYYATDYKNHYANIKVSVIGDFNEKLFGYQKVQRAILNKEASGETCNNITYEEDGIVYFSGTNDCVDMNYVWYSGKLWRITAIYPDGAMKLVTENNITSIAFNESSVNFYTDANNTSYMYQWLNEDFYDTLYNANGFIDTSKQWNTTSTNSSEISTKPAETVMVTANVGLLNNYEYYNSYRCIDNDACSGNTYDQGYLNIGYQWWLLNPADSSQNWYVQDGGKGGKTSAYSEDSVRPSINLKNDVEFSGVGSVDNPFKLIGDKEIGHINDLINTRLSGEYIELKNGNNQQLFRIVTIDENKTKIISMDYANNSELRKFSTVNTDVFWGSGTTTSEGTWYTYFNNIYLPNLVTTYGNIFDEGMYYYGISGKNYKLGICASETNDSVKNCLKTDKNGLYDIGLLRYGEIFATQQAGGRDNSIIMWLMNGASSNKLWYVGKQSHANINREPTYEHAARPTLHLKSSVKIISGTGTENDPYVVGL